MAESRDSWGDLFDQRLARIQHPAPVPARPKRDTFANRAPDPNLFRRALHQVAEVLPPPVKELWIPDAYQFSKVVGEVRYAIAAKASMLYECRMRPEVKTAHGWKVTEDPRAVAVLNELRTPNDHQGDLLAQAARHAEVAGDMWLYGRPRMDRRGRPSGLYSWQFLSKSELVVERKGTVEVYGWGRGVGQHRAPPDGYIQRFLIYPDPEYSERSMSPVFGVLPLMRQLVLLEQLTDAIAFTQINAGIFFLPDEVSFGPLDEWDDPQNPANGEDPLDAALNEYTVAAVRDNSSPNRFNPLVFRGPAGITVGDKIISTKDAMGLVDIARDLDTYCVDLRAELVKRIAQGLDIPPELIQGRSSLSGLGGGRVADSVDEDWIARHVIPLGRRICDWLTVSYYRPMLNLRAGMGQSQADWFRIGLDPSPITSESDLSGIATEGYKLPVPTVSAEAWRRHAGFGEDDAPTDEESYDRTLRELMGEVPEFAAALLPVLYPEMENVQQVAQALADIAAGTQQRQVTVTDVDAAPEPQLPGGDRMLRAVAVLADKALSDALDTAGRRLLRRAAHLDPERAATLGRLKRGGVLTAAGREFTGRCVPSVATLFDGDVFAGLARGVREGLAAEMAAEGHDPETADRFASAAAEELVTQMLMLAQSAVDRRLPVTGNGTRVPDGVVLSAFQAAEMAVA